MGNEVKDSFVEEGTIDDEVLKSLHYLTERAKNNTTKATLQQAIGAMQKSLLVVIEEIKPIVENRGEQEQTRLEAITEKLEEIEKTLRVIDGKISIVPKKKKYKFYIERDGNNLLKAITAEEQDQFIFQ